MISLSKFVLYVSDESVFLYRVASKSVTLLFQQPWRMPVFEKTLAENLDRYVGDGSVLILNDTVEQHYRKEKISKLSPLDRKNIINRKLAMAFPGYPTRAALEIKDPKVKKKSSDSKTSDHMFLFAAVPVSEAYRKIVETLRLAQCGIRSLTLLPVESVSMVDKIFDRLEKENTSAEKAQWRVLMGQHEGGGLRQIVVKNGQIALTRITPVVLPEAGNGAQWASDVAHEFESTLSYLSRFGFVPTDGLDVALIGNPEMASLVGDMISVPCNFYPLALGRAAELAGVDLGSIVQTTNFGNPLYAAWVAKKRSTLLPLEAKEIVALAKPRQMALLGALVLLCVCGFSGYMASDEYIRIDQASKNLEIVNVKKREAEQIYQDEVKRKEALGIDIPLIQSTLGVYGTVSQEYFDPMPLMQIVSQELQDLKIESFELKDEYVQAGSAGNAATPAPPPPTDSSMPKSPVGKATLVLKFKFTGDIKPQDGNKQMEDFRARLKVRLPSDSVEITKNLADLSFTGQLNNVTSAVDDGKQNKDGYTAEVTIIKDIYAEDPGA